jgi:hypothetical protein
MYDDIETMNKKSENMRLVCGIITGMARTETTMIEMRMNSFGLSEIKLSIILSGFPTEYICFLSFLILYV